jgi:2-methylcitrate dehydratase PrpD
MVTRREMLAGTGGSLVLAATASDPVVATEGPGSVTARLSSYMSDARNRALPAGVLEAAKHHILDTFAAMVSGVDLPPARLALKFARAYQGDRVATVAASDISCGPIEAALANGMLAHSDETDDSHAPSHSHPGCAVVPAALAAGERFGISGQQFMRAVTLGYDIGPRVTMTLGGESYQIATHRSTHSIAANFGACAAAGCAAGLNAQQMRWVLDYAAQQAAGIAAWQRDTEHIEKALVFAGWPARNAVTAALLIQMGGSGVPDIFSGADNFLLAFAPHAESTQLASQLGERFEITRTNIKKWTVGSPIQAPLDALVLMRKRHPFEADQVIKVNIRIATSEAKTVDNRAMPDINLQHMVAVMLLDKTVTFQAAHDRARMQSAAVLREKSKVSLLPDEGLERLYPRRVSIVEVQLRDGTQLTERVDAVRGTAENPMTREEVIEKAHGLMAGVLGSARSDALVQRVMNLEKLSNIRELRPLLQRESSTKS